MAPTPVQMGTLRDPARDRLLTARFAEPDLHTLKGYGDYEALAKAIRTMEPADVLDELNASGVRGRGGAGFPTGKKASFLPKDNPNPTYLCVNADESEPGTFKDRDLMRFNPHQLIEGIVVTCYAISCAKAFIFIRGEYGAIADVLDAAVAEATARGYLGEKILGSDFSLDLVVHRGGGAYICGEETALIESLEGLRGQPRVKPPFPAVAGLYKSPTLVNNVETLSTVPHIVMKGGAWYAGFGTERSTGTRVFSISGHVRQPGNYEVELTATLWDLVQMAGGMRAGHALKAIIPGGASAPILTADAAETPVDFESIAAAGSMAGSGAVMIFDETTVMPRLALRLVHFFAHESCGKCTPCREGVPWLEETLQRIVDGRGSLHDIEMLEHIGDGITGNCLCPLGDSAVVPVASTLKHWRGEYERAVRTGRCPESYAPRTAVGAR